jgi:hypothetical protein
MAKKEGRWAFFYAGGDDDKASAGGSLELAANANAADAADPQGRERGGQRDLVFRGCRRQAARKGGGGWVLRV